MNKTPQRRSSRPPDAGTAMLLVIGYLAVMMVGSAAFFSFLHITLSNLYRAERQQVCMNLAEAGIEKASASLRANPGYEGEADTPLGMGAFTVTVQAAGGGAYDLVSTGFLSDEGHLLARARIRVRATIRSGGITLTQRREETGR